MMPLAIKAAGMVTAVGFNFPASAAAMRAGIRNVNRTNLWDAYSAEFVAAGKVPLPQWWVGLGKLAEMAAPAIHECLLAAQPVPPEEIPILLGVSDPQRPFRFADLDQQILGEIGHRLKISLHSASQVIARDHVAVVVALRRAAELLEAKTAPCCVVAAVDSLLQQDLLEHYLRRRRILSPVNSNGFSPGEAGSALLVTPSEEAASGELQVLGTGLTREQATIESDEPLKGDGLTLAVAEAFQASGLTILEMQYRITDLNGEHYKFKEMVLAMLRYERKPKPRLFDLWHPIEFIGDVGAAIGPLVLGVGLHASQKGYGIGPTILFTLGNDDGERAALVARYCTNGNKR